MDNPDYIIVGAGSAGAALAYRLCADGRSRVLLLEAGPSHRHPMVSMPKGIAQVLGNPNRTWRYQTEPGDGFGAEHWIRGKLLGGSSSINGMMYFRAQQADFDDWVAAGATGWGGEAVWQAYGEMENHALGAGNGRGTSGPLKITVPESRDRLAESFIAAGERMGLCRVADLNNPMQEGVGYAPHSIAGGMRMSSARAFLDQAKSRPNLEIVTGFEAERVLFEGQRAVGVTGLRGGAEAIFRTQGEIILSAGALNSPAILQRSGVGDPQRLAALGIPIVAQNRHVGEHLLEHRALMLNYDLAEKLGENHQYRGGRLVLNGLRYLFTRSGPMAAPPYPVAGFFRSRPGLSRPDAEIIFAPYVARMLETGPETETSPSFQVFSFPARSRSQGSVRIRSRDMAVMPAIQPNYLADPYDQEVTISCYRFTVEWMRQPEMARLIAKERDLVTDIVSDEDILRAYREKGSSTFHSCGTCRMGDGPDTVLDSRLRVRGVQGLRVADASVMPTMPSCNINGPVMAVGWRAGDIVLADRAGR
ncbi:GMC family oxidoreductase [Novosphingobium rosa]|uniref:GMC family oxidoreductase n=1 Tax=Novosphingobium rosa TaxID=76978 RepID=UPI00082E6D33|nr:GMC family oxidoreductase N-terminal domain-containing protein [Novosphingobium rosa]